MKRRIMQVFYDNDCLPYKDSERTVHYPIVGNSFAGSNNVDTIRFYVRDIGGVESVTWVANAKLPNGKIIYQVLSTIGLDQELNEYYVELDVNNFYTQLKGDVYISLNGCDGNVEIETDPETDIQTITAEINSRTIQTTGAIKLSINYAPQRPLGVGFDIDQYQNLIDALSNKANVFTTIQVVANISTTDLSQFEDGQLLYDLLTKQYYEKIAISPYYQEVENGAGILGSKRTLIRYFVEFNVTLGELRSIFGTRIAIIKNALTQEDITPEYLINFNSNGVRFVDLSLLKTYYADTTNSSVTNYASDSTSLVTILYQSPNPYQDDVLHEENYKDFAVPYSGAKYNVDLNSHNIKSEIANSENTKKGGFDLSVTSSGSTNWHGYLRISSQKNEQDYQSRTEYATTYIEYAKNVNLGQTYYRLNYPEEDGTFATREWTTSAIETLKANSFILVDTTTYPTLDSFSASQGEEGYIYLYPSTNQEQGYLEYIWESNGWLLIGTTQIDLSGYYTKTQADDRFVPYSGATKNLNLGSHSLILNGTISSNDINIYQQTQGTNRRINFIGYSGSAPDGQCPGYIEFGYNEIKIHSYQHSYQLDKNGTYEEIATQNWVGANYVAQTTSGEKVYGTSELGEQMTYDVDSDLVGSGAIVRRETSTGTVVVGTPTSNTHATTKKYVDDSIASAISSVFKYKGTKTVAEINALTNIQVGDVYNVSDSGTLNAGNIQVRVGDNVAWTGSTWDKLAEDIDWSAYDEKFIAAGFFEVQNYNETSGEITFVFATELYDMSYDTNTGVMTIEAI